jgi:hypothetical protein
MCAAGPGVMSADTPCHGIVKFRKVLCKSNSTHVGIECTYDQLCMYMQGRRVEIQTSAHWSLTGRSMTASMPMLSPSRCQWPRGLRRRSVAERSLGS